MTAAKAGDASATFPRHALRASSTISALTRQDCACTQVSIWSKPGDNLSACYPPSECTNPGWELNGSWGTTCWAAGFKPCSCSRGYAKTTGERSEITDNEVCFFPSQGTCWIGGLPVGRWRAIARATTFPPPPRQGNHYYKYKCCPDGDNEEVEEVCAVVVLLLLLVVLCIEFQARNIRPTGWYELQCTNAG